MSEFVRIPEQSLSMLSPGALQVVQHLCEGECQTFADVLQWCESRGDCTYAVVCPGCATQFVLDEDEVSSLERWSTANGHVLSCGLRESA